MRVQNERKSVWVVAFVEIFVIFALFAVWVTDDIAANRMADVSFLYNRCWQMLDCFKHGFYPFLYYNDFGGVGYGSPIFYGQLTLVPFMPFLGSISTFIKVYMLCCLLLNFFAFRSFLKRLSSYATLTSCFYIVSMIFLGFCTGRLSVYLMGVGFSWLFFGYCIDFFRDGRSFYLVILSYFLIWQTNFVAVVFATIVCFGIFVFFFKLSRWKEYFRLAGSTLLVILYNIVNILYHADMIRQHPLWFDDIHGSKFAMSPYPFGGFLYRNYLLSDSCYGFAQFAVVGLFLYFAVKYISRESDRFRIATEIVGVVTLVGYVVGTCELWPFVWEVFKPFFQFPIRYMIFIYGFVLVIFARVIRYNKVVIAFLVLCLLDVVVTNPLGLVDDRENLPSYYSQIVSGEYVGEGFVFGDDVWNEYRSAVHSESGVSYDWTNEYNGVSVDCSVNEGEDVLTLPKLCYKGYQAFGENGERFWVVKGYSNYCQVDIGSYQGILRLEYRVPPVIFFLFGIQVSFVFLFTLRLLWSYRQKLKAHLSVKS